MGNESAEDPAHDAAEADHAAPILAQPAAQFDAVEAALAEALTGAAKAGAWDVVAALTSELRARREAAKH